MSAAEIDSLTGQPCGIHSTPIVWEEGGDDQPTIFGRHYCPDCQDELMAALDATGGDQ